MGFTCVVTSVSFLFPDDDALYTKFVETHDLSEWEEKRYGPFVTYTKEKHATLKDVDKI